VIRLSDEAVGRLRDVAAWPDLPPDRYTVRSLIGRGGMGAVYEAHDRLLDRAVAFKVSNAATPDSGLDERLRAEARVLASLEHPGIVPVHDAGELADGRWFYVMKLVRGRSLKDHVATLSGEAAVLAVFERIAETVAFAHAAGVIHRDLKPSNIMVGSFGEVLVLDWGVAAVLGSHAGDEGVRVGTPGFMSPEQQAGDLSLVGKAADVYSLGALLASMLAAAPSTRRLRAVIEKCKAARPADRYVNAAEVVEELARYRAGLAVSAYRESAWERFGRWIGRYRTFILLVAAYLVMRALFAWWRSS
jgi:serine/threonine protein kinase